MDNVTFIEVDGKEHAIIDRGNEEFTSMLKSTYDEQQAALSTPNLPPAQDKPISFTAGKTCYNDTLRSDHARD